MCYIVPVKGYQSDYVDEGDFPDIYTTIATWAKVTDIHAGFQRIDGKNLLGFNDGISNPFRLSNDVIWTTREDEKNSKMELTWSSRSRTRSRNVGKICKKEKVLWGRTE